MILRMFRIISRLPIFPIHTESNVGNYVVEVQAEDVSANGIHLFNIEELKAISRITDKMYINYEDQEAHEVLKRIDTIIREEANDMAIEARKRT